MSCLIAGGSPSMTSSGKKDRERLVADDAARRAHGVTGAERRVLSHAYDRCHLLEGLQFREFFVLASRGKTLFETVRCVKVVFDRLIAGGGDEDDLFDACRHGLFYHVLDRRFVGKRQHYFGD